MKKIEKEQQLQAVTSIEAAAKAYSEKSARMLARGKKYGLRTEFRRDCLLISAVLSPWLLSWKEASGWSRDDSHVGPDGRVWSSQNWSSDADVEFVIAAHGPQLKELQWLISAIVDCHVAAETVAPLEAYTGERLDFEVLDEVATPPSHAMLKKAIKALKKEQDTCALFSEIHQETIERCCAVMGDDESYRRRVAKRTAESVAHHFGDSTMDAKTLEKVFYSNMTVDNAGAHISLPRHPAVPLEID